MSKAKDYDSSTEWLRANYSHIWYADLLSQYKAGFLAAVCHPHRCSLAILSLPDRIQIIHEALIRSLQGWNPHEKKP